MTSAQRVLVTTASAVAETHVARRTAAMAVTEILMGLEGADIRLRGDTPTEILDQLGFFGHLAIHAGEVDPRLGGDDG